MDVHVKAVFTNNLPAGAFRGFGVNQSNFAMECLIDELCEKGGFDRWQFRYDNAVAPGRMVTTGQVLGEGTALRETLLAVRDAFRSHPRRASPAPSRIPASATASPNPAIVTLKYTRLRNNRRARGLSCIMAGRRWDRASTR